MYRARDIRLGRDVALKVIHARVSRDPDRIKRFEQEARAASALSHPNVCAVYDLGTHEGSPYVVMELLEGESLREMLKGGPLPARKAVDFAAQAAHGLAAAHEKGIIHRDLKPENLFVTKDGRVKVLDFGLAKLTRSDVLAPSGEPPISLAATDSGAILGTVGYMAPEQVRGEPADPRADIFALGCVLYEMVAGQRPFAGATPADTLAAILTRDPRPLAESAPDMPSALESVVLRCLEKRPQERFDEGAEAVAALERAHALSRGSPFTLGYLAFACGRAGRADDARALLDRATETARAAYVPPSTFAFGHAGLGNWDAAFEWFDQAIEVRDPLVMPIKTYSFLAPVRGDARYHALLRKMNL